MTKYNKAELLEIAAERGVEATDKMTKAEIIVLLEAQEPANNVEEMEPEEMTPEESDTDNVKAEENDTDDANDAKSENNAKETTTAAKGTTKGAKVEYMQFAYVGPTLPNGVLKENAVFRGTLEDVKTYLSSAIEEYPQIEKLIVPTNKLAEYAAKAHTAGNTINKSYRDIVSIIKGHKEV